MSRRVRWLFVVLVLGLPLVLIPGVLGTGGAGTALAQSAPGPNLSLTKSGRTTVAPGATLSYGFVYRNLGPGTATGVRVVDALPSDVQYLGGPSWCAPAESVLTCTLPSLAPGQVGSFSIVTRARNTASGVLTNTAEIAANEPDPSPSNNRSTVQTQVIIPTPVPVADLKLDKQAMTNAYAGQPLVYLLGVQNNGPGPATNVVATDPLPEATLFVPEESDGRCTEAAGVVTCQLGTHSARTLDIVKLVLRPMRVGTLSNTASLRADQTDPVPGNNTATEVVEVRPSADVAVAFAASDHSSPGRPFMYEVQAVNRGPSPASAVTLTDSWTSDVPGGVELLEVSASQGECAVADAEVTCRFGELAPGGAAGATLLFQPRGHGTVAHAAAVSAGEHDPDPTDNTLGHEIAVEPGPPENPGNPFATPEPAAP
jgi:uncharacterized repeat protein (TIGR01451 family)